MKSLAAVVFPGFELLDLYGPLEMFGRVPNGYEISVVGPSMEPVPSAQGPRTSPDVIFGDSKRFDMVLIPGGPGTPVETDDISLNHWLIEQSRQAELVMSVCTGSALLAKIGLLDGRSATTNKDHFAWATAFGKNVDWKPRARWVKDDLFVTSSGVSAGIDMSLGVIALLDGQGIAEAVALLTEYEWQQDPDRDPFAERYGLV